MSGYDDEPGDDTTAAVNRLANAITPMAAMPGPDATGGHVGSLTEAVMGMTAGLCRIADAIDRLAAAAEDHGEPT